MDPELVGRNDRENAWSCCKSNAGYDMIDRFICVLNMFHFTKCRIIG